MFGSESTSSTRFRTLLHLRRRCGWRRPSSPPRSCPGRVSPLRSRSVELPGTMSATMPPRRPLLFSTTCESLGTGYSPSSSRRISTPSLSIRKRCTRPMFTPRICTGSPRRMPPASATLVVTMYAAAEDRGVGEDEQRAQHGHEAQDQEQADPQRLVGPRGRRGVLLVLRGRGVDVFVVAVGHGCRSSVSRMRAGAAGAVFHFPRRRRRVGPVREGAHQGVGAGAELVRACPRSAACRPPAARRGRRWRGRPRCRG